MNKKKEAVYYSDYLGLDRVLDAQKPLSPDAHEEMLFIITHQAYELWFKQILHDVDSIINIFKKEKVDEEFLGVIVQRLKRVTEIQKVMIEQFRIMETMTPADFLEFRDYLVPASGFQSYQFRILENKLGLENKSRLKYNNNTHYQSVLSESHQQLVNESENQDSLFFLVEKWLERTPFLNFNNFDFLESYKDSVNKMLQNDRNIIESNPHFTEEEKQSQLKQLEMTEVNFRGIFEPSTHEDLVSQKLRRMSYKSTLAALFITLYRDQPLMNLPYMLINYLIEIDELFSTFRYRHALMVHRMIGTKIGTGGSSGYNYLKATIESHKIFTDFFNLSTFLIPKSLLPELPLEIKSRLGFYYQYSQET